MIMLRLLTARGRRWMSSSTKVMSFGDGSQGQLGINGDSLLGMGTDAYEPTHVAGLPPDVSFVSAGQYHSLSVTSQGEVWAWGRDNEAQLARRPTSSRETWNTPKKVEGLNQVSVKAAYASGVISTVIGEDGSLWVWGKSKRGQLGLGQDITESLSPARVDALAGEEIVKVSLGWGHALALTEDGKLFGWGYYADGRLGNIGKSLEASPLDSFTDKENLSMHGNSFEAAEKLVAEAIEKEKDMPIVWEPTLVQESCDIKVVDIACGLDHSLILCSDGTLLSGGSNTYGQLGRAKKDLGLHPVDINLPPISIASGLGHSLAICKGFSSKGEENEPQVLTWGWNQSGQLGRGSQNNDVPTVVDGLIGEIPVCISGGRVHSFALTEKRELWAWGCGRNGRLGLGSSCDEIEPMFVEALEGYDVLQAVAGFDHSLVLVAESVRDS